VNKVADCGLCLACQPWLPARRAGRGARYADLWGIKRLEAYPTGHSRAAPLQPAQPALHRCSWSASALTATGRRLDAVLDHFFSSHLDFAITVGASARRLLDRATAPGTNEPDGRFRGRFKESADLPSRKPGGIIFTKFCLCGDRTAADLVENFAWRERSENLLSRLDEPLGHDYIDRICRLRFCRSRRRTSSIRPAMVFTSAIPGITKCG
jgi:hypothetical protein